MSKLSHEAAKKLRPLCVRCGCVRDTAMQPVTSCQSCVPSFVEGRVTTKLHQLFLSRAGAGESYSSAFLPEIFHGHSHEVQWLQACVDADASGGYVYYYDEPPAAVRGVRSWQWQSDN